MAITSNVRPTRALTKNSLVQGIHPTRSIALRLILRDSAHIVTPANSSSVMPQMPNNVASLAKRRFEICSSIGRGHMTKQARAGNPCLNANALDRRAKPPKAAR